MGASLQLFAAGIPVGLEVIASSLMLGVAAALVTYELVRILSEPRKDVSMGNLLEHQRRTTLRQRFSSYRLYEPLVDRLTPYAERQWASYLPQLKDKLDLIDPHAPWKASEYLVVKLLEAVPLVLLMALLIMLLFGFLPALTIVALAALILPSMSRRQVTKRARLYRIKVRNQLPLVVDLMALMLESGAIFRECLETVASENRGEAVGEEFGRVCRTIDQGLPQAEALRGMAERMVDADVSEMVFAINTAEERGTRLKETLSEMSEQMRHRRIQWMEQAAEEAKVHITWPGMLIMIACLLIVAAPLLLEGLGSTGR